jgi:hypothetical protein
MAVLDAAFADVLGTAFADVLGTAFADVLGTAFADVLGTAFADVLGAAFTDVLGALADVLHFESFDDSFNMAAISILILLLSSFIMLIYGYQSL